eukprot:CAMPEP_0168585440 /NCGR_PEP_ID=MMETSP0420-20121227/3704_1 /TAXON_ID=498008 /ORGANISM="Pessonella sp." /LENGTH=596 /DNA_ID=CAMNT_0008620369 /DNA_START=35 /DNA_END=1825 /DNA_ORIENTATION=+
MTAVEEKRNQTYAAPQLQQATPYMAGADAFGIAVLDRNTEDNVCQECNINRAQRPRVVCNECLDKARRADEETDASPSPSVNPFVPVNKNRAEAVSPRNRMRTATPTPPTTNNAWSNNNNNNNNNNNMISTMNLESNINNQNMNVSGTMSTLFVGDVSTAATTSSTTAPTLSTSPNPPLITNAASMPALDSPAAVPARPPRANSHAHRQAPPPASRRAKSPTMARAARSPAARRMMPPARRRSARRADGVAMPPSLPVRRPTNAFEDDPPPPPSPGDDLSPRRDVPLPGRQPPPRRPKPRSFIRANNSNSPTLSSSPSANTNSYLTANNIANLNTNNINNNNNDKDQNNNVNNDSAAHANLARAFSNTPARRPTSSRGVSNGMTAPPQARRPSAAREEKKNASSGVYASFTLPRKPDQLNTSGYGSLLDDSTLSRTGSHPPPVKSNYGVLTDDATLTRHRAATAELLTPARRTPSRRAQNPTLPMPSRTAQQQPPPQQQQQPTLPMPTRSSSTGNVTAPPPTAPRRSPSTHTDAATAPMTVSFVEPEQFSSSTLTPQEAPAYGRLPRAPQMNYTSLAPQKDLNYVQLGANEEFTKR